MLYKRAIAVIEDLRDRDHPLMARDLGGLASLRARENEYASAETLYKRAISIFENTLDRDHPRMAAVLQGLAVVYSAREQYAGSEALLKRALEIRLASLGERHPAVAETLESSRRYTLSRTRRRSQAVCGSSAAIARRSRARAAKRLARRLDPVDVP